jgi:hypothetical protein
MVFVVDSDATESLHLADIINPHGDSPFTGNPGEEVGERFCPIILFDNETIGILAIIIIFGLWDGTFTQNVPLKRTKNKLVIAIRAVR